MRKLFFLFRFYYAAQFEHICNKNVEKAKQLYEKCLEINAFPNAHARYAQLLEDHFYKEDLLPKIVG